MRIGIGLPAAVPEVDATIIGDWAAEAERSGFSSVGVFDRLVYDNIEPLTALAAAATCTKQIELVTTVLTVGWRSNPVLLAKQIASVDLLSGGRFTAGIGLGGWPEDFAASQVPESGKRVRLDYLLATMRRAWVGDLQGQGGAMRRLPEGRPALLLGGLVPAAYVRAATEAKGWVAPLFSLAMLEKGAAEVQKGWSESGREGQPRIVTGRYFCLGRDADSVADEYIRHYYGEAYFNAARSDTLTSQDQLLTALAALEAAGTTDLVLYSCTGAFEQIGHLREAIGTAGDFSGR
jgi:alkanesulfonate monooxygenase SsuD/methylene tetrahydromethanopterin reductase-like flavin-dependent oxidoreductase (luciferase family)